MANVFLPLRAEDAGIKCAIIESVGKIRRVQKALTVEEEPGDTVTILFLGRAEEVTLFGFEYPLQGGVLKTRNPALGVSNELIGRTGKIGVKKGSCLFLK